MSNIPGLLRQTADSLRKEAMDSTAKAEAAFYAAQALVKVAYETADAANNVMQLQMIDAMKEQAEIARSNGLMTAIHNRVTHITPEEAEDLKRNIAAIEATHAARNSAYDAVPISPWKRALVGAGIGMAPALVGMAPITPLTAAVGGIAGLVNGINAKNKYSVDHAHDPEHMSQGNIVAQGIMAQPTRAVLERKMRDYAGTYDAQHPAYVVEHLYELDPDYTRTRFHDSMTALQKAASEGLIGTDVALVALYELQRRMNAHG